MKKYLFLFLILPTIVRAQITLSATDYPGPYTGIDSLKVTATASIFPAMWPFAGAAWDMTITTDSASDMIMYRMPSSFGDYADSVFRNIDIFGFRPPSLENIQVNITSKSQNSVSIETQSFGLAPFTATSTDTLYIPQQVAVHSNPITLLQFPAAYGNSWGSDAVTDVNFELTVASLSLFHTPCIKRTYLTRRDSVRGWGSMRVRTAAGTPSDFMDVLQVNSTAITVDSFFIDGATSHPALLIAGMTQGQRDTTYTQYYYRKGVLRPLATVTHKNGLYTQPQRAWIHRQQLPTEIPGTLTAQTITVFPNPANTTITLTIPGLRGVATCRLQDIAGKELSSFGVWFDSGTTTAKLPTSIAAGTYLLQVVTPGQVYTSRVTLQP